jgi:hypothetical protein
MEMKMMVRHQIFGRHLVDVVHHQVVAVGALQNPDELILVLVQPFPVYHLH